MIKLQVISFSIIILIIIGSANCSYSLESNNPKLNLRGSSLLNNTVIDFIEGLIIGSKILEGIPDLNTCNPFNKKLLDSVFSFLNLLRNLNQENWKHNILHFIAESYDLYDHGYNNLKGCKQSLVESQDLFNRINLYIHMEGYIQKILINAIEKFFFIKDKVEKALIYLNKKETFKAGLAVGDLIDYVFFFDFILK